MQRIRLEEQRTAARVGGYSCQLQLGYTSSDVKSARRQDVIADLETIFRIAKPKVVYLHNLADKHPTHVASSLAALAALRRLPAESRPEKVLGCEVWRNLDWLPDDEKQCLPVSNYPNIAAAVLGVHDSQISGGKRYDLATAGRRLANATYFASHATDAETALTFAMDLTPLVKDPSMDVAGYVTGFVDKMKAEIRGVLEGLA
jgi:LmbE family N-acetylglucosaminyl deacetylase